MPARCLTGRLIWRMAARTVACCALFAVKARFRWDKRFFADARRGTDGAFDQRRRRNAGVKNSWAWEPALCSDCADTLIRLRQQRQACSADSAGGIKNGLMHQSFEKPAALALTQAYLTRNVRMRDFFGVMCMQIGQNGQKPLPVRAAAACASFADAGFPPGRT
jgi:hypothetical protein